MNKILSIVMSLIGGWKTYLIAGVAILAAIGGAYELGHWKGSNDQKLLTAKAETIAIQKGVQGRGEIEKQVNKLADPDLDVELDRWMRD